MEPESQCAFAGFVQSQVSITSTLVIRFPIIEYPCVHRLPTNTHICFYDLTGHSEPFSVYREVEGLLEHSLAWPSTSTDIF